MTQTDAPILGYEQSLSRDRLTIQRGDDGSLRIIAPQLRRWRTLPIGFWIGLTVLTLILGPWILAAAHRFAFRWRVDAIIWIAVLGMPFALLFGVTWFQLGEHFCFDVTCDALTFHRLHRGQETTMRTIALPLVRNVRVTHTGKLAIDVYADEPIEVLISRSTMETNHVADVLKADLGMRTNCALQPAAEFVHGAVREGSRVDC